MRAQNYESLISAYVNETLKLSDRQKVEELIASNADMNSFYREKLQEKDFMTQLIPAKKLSLNKLSRMKTNIRQVNEDVFPKEKWHLMKKFIRHLKEPAVTIEF